jgi:hypothetical protein
MKVSSKTGLWLFLVTLLLSRTLPARADDLLITEFMGLNESTLKDDTGDFSDWIEIYNNGTNTVDLRGYFLTDDSADLVKWQFPSTNLAPSHYLLVFASGLNRVTPGKPFHTNFKLDAAGEYLALVKSNGVTVISEFAPAFPPQQKGLSYGLAVEDINSKVLVSPGASAQVLVPTNNIAAAWVQPGYNDSDWPSATAGLRFDLGSGATSYDNLEGTDIESALYGKSATAYVRIPFDGIDVSRITDLQLLMRYDDGFVAYLNGQEVARRLAPGVLQWNSAATNQHTNSLALVPERINLTQNLSLLQPGRNILAIHALNRTANDSDFLMLPEFIAREIKILTGVQRFFSTPTPGSANVAGLPGAAGAVRFSRESSTFIDSFQLSLDPVEKPAGALIRYTLDRTIPTETSPIYSGPLAVANSLQVRARVFAPGLFPGPVKTGSYIALNPNVVNFTSDLPILVVHSFGAGSLNGATYRSAFMTIHEPVRGRSSLTNPPHLTTRAGFKDRGSSTAGQPKANYAVETWDEDNRNKDISILGLPPDSEWVFHAPYSFDPALIRNPLAFEFGHQLGRYASRYRFVEVYANAATAGGPISSANYIGVYNILEKVKRSKDRVDMDELRPGDLAAPELTGGYLLKVDRTDPGDGGFTAGGRGLSYVEPPEKEIKLPERDPQEKYIIAYLNSFWAALSGANFADPIRGYAPFIEVDSWINHHIVDTLTWNVDALRLSSYFHKERNGPLIYGPLWDYDRSLGSTDARDDNPRVWGDTFFTDPWWARLFRDPNFWQRWIDRWQEVRQGQMSNKGINSIIDSLAAQVAEAAPRDFTKWRQPKAGGSQAGEINFLKNWLASRLEFMDTNLLSKPLFSRSSGQLSADFTLAMIGPDGAAIHYTLDGSDPRLAGGSLSPSALIYGGPITLPNTATVKARSRNLSHRNLTGGNNPQISSPWSGLTQARFSLHPAAASGHLIVTELHYNPAPPSPRELSVDPQFRGDDFEFLELKSISPNPVDLFDARFIAGIEFSFSTSSNLSALVPGQSLVLAKNPSAFKARYGERSNVAGPYAGSLDNDGERLQLVNSFGVTILDFEYRDDWHPITDGHGFSLVLSNDNAGLSRSSSKLSWHPSANPGGSPGEVDPSPMALVPVVINEARTHSNKKDSIELHNPAGNIANVGGWFLTDDRDVPHKFRIPDGTTIPAGEFRTFDEDDFNPGQGTSFSLSAESENVYLFSADGNGNLLWYLHGFEFGAAEEEVTFGRHRTSTGDEDFVAQIAPSLRSANVGPSVGPIVINEIMYHPPDVYVNNGFYDNDEDEFIELRNITSQPVALFDSLTPTNTWTIRGAADFTFPTNVTIPGNGLLVVVGFDPSSTPFQVGAFRAKYGIAPSVIVLGPYSGKLNNSQETVRLFKPSRPENPPAQEEGRPPQILVDAVSYLTQSPWPVAADGMGHSLQRINGSQYGNDPINWSASRPTPGAANRFAAAPSITGQPQGQTIVAGASVLFNVAAASTEPLQYQWRFRGNNLPGATNAALAIKDAQVVNAGEYSVVVVSPASSAVSLPAILSVLQPATITHHPLGRNVNPGTNVTFGVTTSGTGSLKYQWRFNGTNIPGAAGASLTLTSVQLRDSGSYNVVVTDAVGSAVSDPAILNVLVRPEITAQPESWTALAGDTVKLGVTATGTLPMSYRWLRDGTVRAGATNSLLTLSNVQLGDAGKYSVIVTNIASARTPTFSSEAFLIVLADFDRDRMADLWEIANGFSTNNANDAILDSDGDGMTNAQEYLADTDPRDRQNYLRFDDITLSPDFASLQFYARSNRSYAVQFKPSLVSDSWTTLAIVRSRITNRTEVVTDSNSAESNRFYRLATPAP